MLLGLLGLGLLLVVRVHHVAPMVLLVEVGVEGALAVASVASIGVIVVHVAPVVLGAVVEALPIVLSGHIAVCFVIPLLVTVQVVFQVPTANSEDHIEAGGELHGAEDLGLFQHLEVATQCEQAVTPGLMLGTNPVTANLVA